MDNDDIFWQTKLHARLHDPAEKALVLLRDPAGHEGGTSRALHRLLRYEPIPGTRIEPDNDAALHGAIFKGIDKGIASAIYKIVQRADWWAAAADRPQWPMQEVTVATKAGDLKTFGVAAGSQVRWTKKPVLIHPLTGSHADLGQYGGLSDTDIHDIKSKSFQHFQGLLHGGVAGEGVDWKRTLLAAWRFGPSLREADDNGKLGALWPLLPADTRVPDHSIWDHLDLVSAFAGAFSADPDSEAALLTVSIGPVQSFIAMARSTSDLWAGSHLLSRLAWEAMKPVCDALGPDAILFPRLRGVPQVDLWLRDECRLRAELFEGEEWLRSATDANPLFGAALPNRFVTIVPRSRAADLAAVVESAVHGWLQAQGKTVVDRLLQVAGLATDGEQHCHLQMREQLEGFPEVHWAAVPFSLIQPRNSGRQTDLDTTRLSAAMAPFFGVSAGQPAGFLKSPAWQVLSKEAKWDDATTFFAPNPGVLYPAVYDLAERALAAAKAVRPFAASTQQGWRCSLSGETEWLTTDPAQLQRSYRTQQGTLWSEIAKRRPAWAKAGEHLGALAAIKRVWPTLFAEEAGKAIEGAASNKKDAAALRFVVSTHTMSLAHQLDAWLERGAPRTPALQQALGRYGVESVALPRRLLKRHAGHSALMIARRLPGLLDAADELSDETEAAGLRRLLHDTLRGDAGDQDRLETYYGLLMLDGDRMGAWLNGSDDHAISYLESFHPDTRNGFDTHAKRQKQLGAYAAQKRAVSPNRHLAISAALNDFSLSVARHVVEEEHLGRLIYAGGDDVLAMLPVADLLPAMQRLRIAYSGHDAQHKDGEFGGLTLKNGFAFLNGKLMRMMGERATASCGAIVAHHQAPLGAVMRALREAEKRAKGEGGRDAFSLSIIKRSGGALTVTAKWGAVATLDELRRFLRSEGVSRRAVYHSLDWLKDLLADRPEMVSSLLRYQLDRQAEKSSRQRHDIAGLANQLTTLAFDPAQRPKDAKPLEWLAHFMSAAEFLARKTRSRE